MGIRAGVPVKIFKAVLPLSYLIFKSKEFQQRMGTLQVYLLKF